MQEKWGINLECASKSRFKRIRRNYNREYVSCFNNLNKIKYLLEKGAKLSELNSTRTKIIYILGIGTKETQQEDIAAAKELIKNLGRVSSKPKQGD